STAPAPESRRPAPTGRDCRPPAHSSAATSPRVLLGPHTPTSTYFQQLAALRAGAVGGVGGAPRAGRPITGSSSGLAPRPRPPRPAGAHPSQAGPFCSMRVSALTV